MGDEGHNFSHLLPPSWRSEIQVWLNNDIPVFDIGGFVVGETSETALLLAKSKGVLAGVPFFDAVFETLGCTVKWNFPEGAILDPSSAPNKKIVVATVSGKCRMILMGERTGLNLLSRASGIASDARTLVDIAKARGWKGEVAGTRKTTPGFRLVEKYALLVGGASTHRNDLSHMVMLKDNHVWAAGSITKAVRKARVAAGFSSKIEVECRNLEEAMEAASAGADIIMLDNYTPEMIGTDAPKIKNKFPAVTLEASGGITAETIGSFCDPHLDVISRSLTQGYNCVDFSLKIERGKGVLS